MQPEDIIQQKEWQDLSPEEKAIVQEVAADEQEFNLLKSMLLIATEEAAETPAPDPALQPALRNRFAARRTRQLIRRWSYAAAASILLGIIGWLLIQPADNQKPLAGDPEPPEKNILSPRPDTLRRSTDTVTATPVMVKKNRKTIKMETPPMLQTDTASYHTMIAMNTSVGNHAPLLNLVTEVYE